VSAHTVFGKEAFWVELLRVGEELWFPVSDGRYKYNIGTSWEDVAICKDNMKQRKRESS
jgi:hypothetical protein